MTVSLTGYFTHAECRRHAQGRIVSCLEGGYPLGALADL
jgi:hypothetical protein